MLGDGNPCEKDDADSDDEESDEVCTIRRKKPLQLHTLFVLVGVRYEMVFQLLYESTWVDCVSG